MKPTHHSLVRHSRAGWRFPPVGGKHMTSIVSDVSSRVIVGVDTHKHIHVAVAINQHGTRLGDRAVSADSGGYAQLAAWAHQLGRVDRCGIEGTGSYGAGLTSYLRRGGHRVVEVNRGDRRSRRSNGKSDVLDAETAARSILAGTSTTIPKTASWAGGDDPPGQGGQRHRPQGPNLGDHHCRGLDRERSRRAARIPRWAF